MKLLTTLYNEAHPRRAHEFITCLEHNAANSAIDEIHVFYDSTADDGECRVRQAVQRVAGTIREVRGRPPYADLFRYANEYLDGEVVILSNADIHFNETLSLLSSFDWDNVFLAITRDDFVGTHGEGSSDVWIFRPPVPVFGQNVTFGTVYCDQVISYLARKNRLRVHNPCLSIECRHMHQSRIRNRPGTGEHLTGHSTTSDGLQGRTLRDLERQLVRDHGLRLMAFSGFGGGLVWPSKLVVQADMAPQRTGARCRKVPRWQPLRGSLKQFHRAVKRRVRQAIMVVAGLSLGCFTLLLLQR